MPNNAANKSKGKRRSTSQGAPPAPKQTRTVNWSKDVGTDGNSAEYHLVQWLIMRSGPTMRSNFECWKTLPKSGNRGHPNLHKAAIQYLVEKGCSSERKPDTVKPKILSLKKRYIEALQFKNSTGAGRLDGEEQDSGILKMCQYFDDLNEVLFHQAASMPKNGADTLSMGDADPSSVQLDLIMQNIIGKDDEAEGTKEEDGKDEDEEDEEDKDDKDEEDKDDGEEDDNDDDDGDGEERPPIAVIATPARRSVAGCHKALTLPRPLSVSITLLKIAKEHAQRRHDEVIQLETKKMEAEKERVKGKKKKAEQEVLASKLEMWHKHMSFNMERQGMSYEAAAADASAMMPSFMS
ncbi:hypothetical protein L202_03404 [Cryptococcus amylolentus CBS 6039]|uniref:Uncharacterized protein n=1 Tax=Cryptococcus amylolentus CBS 6039 TaxID=1295533 RepID=A0A1E3HSS7_9TREE|nr:hypothetical protein L202_03404 [Cryptococcus amylolentus CBS 6039]ODN79413.1 hypothetical protein L202_03404 [Cryptococcus amylolentus CBS 6039]